MTSIIMALTTALGRMRRSAEDERGAAAVEYGMLVALIAAVCVGAIALLGPVVRDAFTTVWTAVSGAVGGGA